MGDVAFGEVLIWAGGLGRVSLVGFVCMGIVRVGLGWRRQDGLGGNAIPYDELICIMNREYLFGLWFTLIVQII